MKLQRILKWQEFYEFMDIFSKLWTYFEYVNIFQSRALVWTLWNFFLVRWTFYDLLLKIQIKQKVYKKAKKEKEVIVEKGKERGALAPLWVGPNRGGCLLAGDVSPYLQINLAKWVMGRMMAREHTCSAHQGPSRKRPCLGCKVMPVGQPDTTRLANWPVGIAQLARLAHQARVPPVGGMGVGACQPLIGVCGVWRDIVTGWGFRVVQGLFRSI